ncbi:MAG: hypothetical protein ACRD50_16575 [Candidatus Acidiferrales bacterium]
MECPRCGHANSPQAQFCTSCHQTLVFRCPQCWHEQQHGGKCDKCGINFGAFWALYMVKTSAEDQQVARDKAEAETLTLLQLLTLPFSGPWRLVRVLAGWLASFLIRA